MKASTLAAVSLVALALVTIFIASAYGQDIAVVEPVAPVVAYSAEMECPDSFNEGASANSQWLAKIRAQKNADNACKYTYTCGTHAKKIGVWACDPGMGTWYCSTDWACTSGGSGPPPCDDGPGCDAPELYAPSLLERVWNLFKKRP